MANLDELMDYYMEASWQEGLGLEDFVKQLKEGKHGDVSPEEIRAFLQQIERIMLQNIELRTQEGPEYAERAEEVAAETQRMIRRLIETYAR